MEPFYRFVEFYLQKRNDIRLTSQVSSIQTANTLGEKKRFVQPDKPIVIFSIWYSDEIVY